MPRRSLLIVSSLACAGILSIAASASAQATNGAFGSRTMGGSFSQPASSFGGSAAAKGAAALAGGAMANGAGGSAAGATTRGDASAGQVSGNERFLRNNRQGQRSFVGADANDAQNPFSQLTNMLTGGNLNNNNGRQRNDNNRNNNPNNTASRTNTGQASKARVQQVVGFEYAAPATTSVGAKLEERLQKSPRIQQRSPITVRLEGRTAVLSGTVATEHDRALAAQVARLEAGVSEIRNELQIEAPLKPGPSLPSSETLPSSNTLPSPALPASPPQN